jgi:hypothetical protein
LIGDALVRFVQRRSKVAHDASVTIAERLIVERAEFGSLQIGELGNDFVVEVFTGLVAGGDFVRRER